MSGSFRSILYEYYPHLSTSSAFLYSSWSFFFQPLSTVCSFCLPLNILSLFFLSLPYPRLLVNIFLYVLHSLFPTPSTTLSNEGTDFRLAHIPVNYPLTPPIYCISTPSSTYPPACTHRVLSTYILPCRCSRRPGVISVDTSRRQLLSSDRFPGQWPERCPQSARMVIREVREVKQDALMSSAGLYICANYDGAGRCLF